jgi:hypothetical protein
MASAEIATEEVEKKTHRLPELRTQADVIMEVWQVTNALWRMGEMIGGAWGKHLRKIARDMIKEWIENTWRAEMTKEKENRKVEEEKSKLEEEEVKRSLALKKKRRARKAAELKDIKEFKELPDAEDEFQNDYHYV